MNFCFIMYYRGGAEIFGPRISSTAFIGHCVSECFCFDTNDMSSGTCCCLGGGIGYAWGMMFSGRSTSYMNYISSQFNKVTK